MSVTIKLVNGTQKSVDVPDLNISVLDFKKLTAPVVDIPADEQRVVLRGRVLKDTDNLSACGMEHGGAVHVVRSKKKDTAAAAAPQSQANLSESAASAPSANASVATNTSNAAPPSSSNPYAALSSANLGGSSASPAGNMFGGPNNWANPGVGAEWGASPEDVMQMMQNPMMMQFMNQMMQNPQMMQQIRQSSPLLANMPPEAFQQAMQMMNNPEMMQQIMGTFGGAGGQMPSMAGQNPAVGQPNISSNPGMNSMGFNPAMFSAPQPQGDPRTIYREQLQQLREMGFPNEDANIAALQQSQGNLSFAIERLLSA